MCPSKTTNSQDSYLDEPKAGRLNIEYSPAEGSSSIENPPRFMWIPVVEDEAQYVLKISNDKSFPAKSTDEYTDISVNFLTPDKTFTPGEYYCCYAVWDGPGMIDTDFHNIFTKDEVRSHVANITPLKREGSSEDVANLAVFLASDEAAFMTGTNVDINGGLLFS